MEKSMMMGVGAGGGEKVKREGGDLPFLLL